MTEIRKKRKIFMGFEETFSYLNNIETILIIIRIVMSEVSVL